MDILALPRELFQLVLVAAVRARTLERALRLRLVNRLFSSAVMTAILDARLLESFHYCKASRWNQHPRGCSWYRERQVEVWAQYLAFQATRRRQADELLMVSVIRDLAECFLKLDFQSDPTLVGDALNERRVMYISELSRARAEGIKTRPKTHAWPFRWHDGLAEGLEPFLERKGLASFSLDRQANDDDFSDPLWRELFSAACWLGRLDVIFSMIIENQLPYNHR
jgi:hypothetical protein